MTPSTPPKKQWSWRSQAFRGLVYQALALGLITLALWYLAHNTLINMRARGIQSGFDFLLQTAGFDIGESLFAFDSSEKYWRAFLVGLTNTLRVALLGILFTTLLARWWAWAGFRAMRWCAVCAQLMSRFSATYPSCCNC